jgi:hypothetical protein
VIPVLFGLLTALTIIPVGQALLELIIHPVTVADVVDRTAYSNTLVALDGFALLVPFQAEPSGAVAATGSTYHWYVLSGELGSRRLLLMRSSLDVDALRTRTLFARLVDDPAAVNGAVGALTTRGASLPAGPPVARLLDEVGQPIGPVRTIGSLGEIASLASGEVIRVQLRVERGIASCVPPGTCSARRLAAGVGSWDNLALDPGGGGWAILRTSYPPSQAPFSGVGRQEPGSDVVDRFLGSAAASSLLGWAFVLETAFVDHDPNLPINHLWLGPILFAALTALLLLGLRVGYPRFVVSGAAASAGPAMADPPVLSCRVSGRITPPDRSPFEVTDQTATISAAPGGGSQLELRQDGAQRLVTIPQARDGLSLIELGVMRELRRQQPALKVGWFGSNLLLVFSDRAARDAAAALVQRSR